MNSSIDLSNAESKPQIQPGSFMANGEEIEVLESDGVLYRSTWQLITDPEPSIGYDLNLLADAQERGAFAAYTCDLSTGLGYCADFGRIFVFGIRQNYERGVRILLPLRYWDVFHGKGRITDAELPPITEQMVRDAFRGVA